MPEIFSGRSESAVSGVALPVTGFWGRQVEYTLNTTLYTRHLQANTDHNNHQSTIDVERWQPNGWLQGIASLRNSFYQPIQYLYVGKAWRPLDEFPAAYIKLTGGLIHGYQGRYKDKVPLNFHDVAPVLLPSVGVTRKDYIVEALFFGTAGVMINVGVVFR